MAASELVRRQSAAFPHPGSLGPLAAPWMIHADIMSSCTPSILGSLWHLIAALAFRLLWCPLRYHFNSSASTIVSARISNPLLATHRPPRPLDRRQRLQSLTFHRPGSSLDRLQTVIIIQSSEPSIFRPPGRWCISPVPHSSHVKNSSKKSITVQPSACHCKAPRGPRLTWLVSRNH